MTEKRSNKMLPRTAFLYNNFQQKGNPTDIVTVHFIGQVGVIDEGFSIAASVEKLNGQVSEVPHDWLRFFEYDSATPADKLFIAILSGKDGR